MRSRRRWGTPIARRHSGRIARACCCRAIARASSHWPHRCNRGACRRRISITGRARRRRSVATRRMSRSRPGNWRSTFPKRAWRRVTLHEGANTKLASRFVVVRVRSAHRDYHRSAPPPRISYLIEWPASEPEPKVERFPPQGLETLFSSKNTTFPTVIDPADPPIRPERHLPASIPSVRIAIPRATARTIPCCPCRQSIKISVLLYIVIF